MSYLDKIRLAAAIGAVIAVLPPVILRAEDPKDVQSSVFLNCDVHLIRRLLLNLLDNALKYNHAEGWIRLHVGLKAGLAVIAVANSGPEIPAEHRAHLFEPFYRADNSRSRRTGGTGLGLNICREIVALHQGTIRLCKSTGEETIFEVSLPTI